MTNPSAIYVLPERGVVAVSGDDAMSWLDNLVSNDISDIATKQLVFAALLSPQGKVLFEFFVHRGDAGVLLETASDAVVALLKRLGMYKLRAKVELRDVSADWAIVWSMASVPLLLPDPRAPTQLWRGLRPRAESATSQTAGPYLAERVHLGIGEAPQDYVLGNVFPHEANFDLMDGVSFTKGCYVGQEVVSRMQNKSVVRKRVARIFAGEPLTSGADVTAGGGAVIGKVGSVAGTDALAMLRLDRVAEAHDTGQALRAGATPITVDSAALDRYRHTAANRPASDL